MIRRTHRLSSTPVAFSDECNKLRSIFLILDYPITLINSSINTFVHNIDNIDTPKNASLDTTSSMITIPFKDQQSANSACHPEQEKVLAPKDKKAPFVSNQCVVYKSQCKACDADYVEPRHLHQRISKQKYSAIGRHLEEYLLSKSTLEDKQFSILENMKIEV